MARRIPRNQERARHQREKRRREEAEAARAQGRRPDGTKSLIKRAPSAGNHPSALTDIVTDGLLHSLISGNSVTASCALMSVPISTFYNWMSRGKEARGHLDATGNVAELEIPYLAFMEAVLDARAQAEVRAVGVVHEAMRGGQLLSEKPLQDLSGNLVTGPDGEIVYERHYSTPDGRLAMQYLQRAFAGDWSPQATKVEVTGEGGGPVKHEHSVEQVDDLTARIAAVKARQADDAEHWDGHQVIEGGIESSRDLGDEETMDSE